MNDSQKALAEWLGVDPNELQEREVNESYADYYEYDGKEYAVYDNWYDAESEAIDAAENILEDIGFTGLDDDFKENIIDSGLINERFFEEMMHESNESYASDIKDESSDKYASRLIEECIDNGIIDESELDENGNYTGDEDLVYEYAEYLDNEEDSALDWYRLNYGDEDLNDIIEENDLLKTNEVAGRMVELDGIERYLSVDDTYEEVDYNGVEYFVFCTYE